VAGLLSEIVALAVATGAAEVRRLRARIVLGLFAVMALLIAFAFGLVAFSLWLTLHMAAWQAALLAGAAALALAGIFLLAARRTGRRPPRDDVAAQVRAVLAEVTKEGGEMTPMGRVTAAVAAGIVIGRMLSR
jgi:hypothetical protein